MTPATNNALLDLRIAERNLDRLHQLSSEPSLDGYLDETLHLAQARIPALRQALLDAIDNDEVAKRVISCQENTAED